MPGHISASTSTYSSSCKRNLRQFKTAWRSPVWQVIARGRETTKSFNTSNLVYHLKTKHLEDVHRFLMMKEKESEREAIKKERSEKKSVGGLRQLTLQRREDLTMPWNKTM